MALDLYGPCPCGSGKKFKWCCQPIHVDIDRAFRQDAEGQHEAALRIMDDVTQQHPDNPEAWGRKAQLLFQNDKTDEAESTLQKALEINPNYPFGYLLRGLFRQHEGEVAGALLLFRKAAELYDPEAKDILSQVYSMIGDAEMRLHRPVAARAALKMCMRLQPSDELQQTLENVFGDKSHLPLAARRDYAFQSPPAGAPSERRAAWDRALGGASSGKLTDAARAFEELTSQNADDAAAWYNLALVRAWRGDNAPAIEALDRYVTLEADDKRAATAWDLAEVLRFSQGLEDRCDYVEQSALYQIRDPQRLFDFLQQWQQERRLTGVQVREDEGMVTGIVVEHGGLVTAGAAPAPSAKLAAYLMIAGNLLRVWGVIGDAVDRVRREIQERVGPALSEARLLRGPANFGDVFSEATVLPTSAANNEEAEKIVRDGVQSYFEEKWIHRPLKSLDGAPPVDAAGHAVLRKKLLGLVQFLEESAASVAHAYDFDRLRRKLGLAETPTVGAGDGQAGPGDIGAMSAGELAALLPERLTDEQLDEAYRTAQKLDAHELAGRFAQAYVARPPRADEPDRYPWYSYLVQQAMASGNTDAALGFVDAGQQADAAHNEGRRGNDYELRRGQVLTKKGDAEAARQVFEKLIERTPAELRYRGSAAESMLAMKQSASALQFAEQGLAKAREKNDRDSEQYFMELVAAAKKQTR